MKSRRSLMAVGLATAALTAMTGCAGPAIPGDSSSPTGSASTPVQAPVTLTMSAWSLATTPEFKALTNAYRSANPNVTIEIVEYDANTYEQLLLTDMAAKKAPDVIVIKQAKYTYQWATGGQLMDISDVAATLSSDVSGAGSYKINGKNYGIPYRQDSWLLFYDKDLFDKAGVALPDGNWTWDDYANTAKELTTKLAATGISAKGTYQHSWQSTLQGFANAQKGDVYSGDYSYMAPYYQRVLDLQNAGAQESFGTVTSNKLTYQGEFGKQSTAMMLMGSWYIATLVNQQASGDANQFTWGLAPAPQVDKTTVSNPVTVGDPTGIGVNAGLDPTKAAAAKAFVAFCATEDAAKALAGIGITPSTSSANVTNTIFANKGMPMDDLSKKAFQTHVTKPENPSGQYIMQIQTIMNTAHTAIMSETTPIDAALTKAGADVKSQNW